MSIAGANRPFQFDERSQLFIRPHDESAFRRRDARRQSRLFARWNPRDMFADPSAPLLIIPVFTELEKAFLCMDLSRRTRTQNR
jgi:hypothetical protein